MPTVVNFLQSLMAVITGAFLRIRPNPDVEDLNVVVDRRVFDFLNAGFLSFVPMKDDEFAVADLEDAKPIPDDFRVRELDFLFSNLLLSNPSTNPRPFIQIWAVVKAELLLDLPLNRHPISRFEHSDPEFPIEFASALDHVWFLFSILFDAVGFPPQKQELYARQINRIYRRRFKRSAVQREVIARPAVEKPPPDETRRKGELEEAVQTLRREVSALAQRRAELQQQISNVAHRLATRSEEVKVERKAIRVVSDLMFVVDDLNQAIVHDK
jgi:signal transduction histidine kinase